MAYKHGVYVTEAASTVPAKVPSDLGVQVVIGVAPVNMAADPSKAVNVPLLCNTLEEATAAVGYSEKCDFSAYTLCQSIDMTFNKFNVAPIVLINVLDPAKHKTSVTQAEFAVKNRKATISQFGVLLSSVAVKATAAGAAMVKDTDYVLSFDSDGYVTVAFTSTGAGSSATSVYIAFDKLDPSKVTVDDIIGGTTAEGVETGLALIRQIYPLFGVNAGLITAPGWSKNAAAAAIMESVCTDINGCFVSECIVDIDATTTKLYTDVEAAKTTLGVTSGHTIVCWPMWSQDGRIYSMSAVASALMIANDMGHDEVPYTSPDNKSMGDGYTCLSDGTKVLLDQPQANVLNGAGVCTGLNLRGFKFWGNNTAAYPGTNVDFKDRWISVRRFFTWWTNRFINTYISAVGGNVSKRQVETIVDDENIRCNGYVARGYCAGAKIAFLYSQSDLVNGKIAFTETIGGYPPIEEIENTVTCDLSYVAAEFGGEA